MSRKAQAAMEYLMTYGWAILIVIIVAAALYALGIFDPSTWTGDRATGFTNIGAPASGAWLATASDTENNFQINLQNNLPSRVNITGVTVDGIGTGCTIPAPANITAIGGAINLAGNCSNPTAGSYTATVTITYNNIDTGLDGFVEKGTITGSIA